MNSQALKESRQKPGNQGHGCGSGKESSSSPYISHDAVHGMNTSVPTDNGVVSRIAACRKEDAVEADAKVLPHVAKSPSIISTAVGSTKVPHSSATAGEGVQQSSVASFPNLPKYDTYAAAVMSWSSLPRPKDDVDHKHSV
ncbi:hypothetical protein Nepgr_007696 [Nepenthes gracilis]|uniref:Uncharacterized protein n=1 Tax=Nepenthes gracilis TaxID=150966 RepID=A0AAD3S8C1_NEPGR|nr:hypothetical protein Nepgr_007696 [Nepenthes gracilis]